MKAYLEDIVVHLTMCILEWEKAGPFKRQAYAILIKNGMQNDTFFNLTQLACDYCDYLIFHVREQAERAVINGSDKALELHIALMVEKTGQLKAELPSIQNYYKARINEYPELKRKVMDHLSSYGNNLGAKEMIPNQPFIDQNTQQWVMYNNQGQLVYCAPPQQQAPSLTQQWDQSHARRQAAQYGAQQPQHQPAPPAVMYNNQGQPMQQWGPNNAVQMQQAQGQMVNSYQQPVPQQPQPLGPSAGGYANYNNNPVQNNTAVVNNSAGLGPMVNHNQPLRHPGASSQQRHTDLPAPQTEDKAVPIASTHMPGHAPKAAPAAPVVEVKNPLEELVETPSGFECSYSYGNSQLGGVMGSLPILFDVANMKGVYQLDANHNVTGFKLVHYKEKELDYKTHETSQFFNKTRSNADDPSRKETRAMLASIQRKLFVEEKLAEVENEVLVGNVTNAGDVEYDLSDPLVLVKTLYGRYGETDYIGRMFQNYNTNAKLATVTGRVVNFEHMCWNGIDLSNATAEVASRINKVKDWFELNDILNDLVDAGLPLSEWKLLNDIITNFVNDVLAYRLNVDIVIQSFNVDIEELIGVLHKEHGIRNDFVKTLRELTGTALFPINADHEDYIQYIDLPEIGEDDEFDANDFIIFTTLSDVTVLPMESSSIYIPLPEKDDEWLEAAPVACIVTWESYTELYNAIHDRMTNKNIRASQVVFVTADGVNLYIKKTSSDDAYVVSRVA